MQALDKQRHIKYWQRCRDTYLPTPYTSNDSTRLTLAFFIIAAQDLLSVPTQDGAAAARAWILSLQHPDGGFCGSSTHAMVGKDARKGSANLAATYFALILLAMLAPSEEEEERRAFADVQRGKLLRWLRRLQRRDGSFGQLLWDGEPVGGWDVRHSYLAAGVRWIMRGDVGRGDELWEEDVDVEKMVGHINSVQTYDGGISESSQQESHAGYAFCAVAALALLDRTDPSTTAMQRGIANRPGLLKWLAHRQFTYLAEAEASDESGDNYVEAMLGRLSLDDDDNEESRSRVGSNGRWHKKADTCYSWWVGGSLHLLGEPGLFERDASRNYLLDVTQHSIGGFSKAVGGPPDIYHSYLGLAALSMMGVSELKEMDFALCCSREAARKTERARQGLLQSLRRREGDEWATDEFWDKASTVA